MKTIVITGSKGFIGQRLHNAIVEKYGPKDAEPIKLYRYDLKDGTDILDVAIPKADIIFHLAAQTDVQESLRDPMYDAMTNIAGTIKVLKENPDAKIIITGSAAGKDPKSPYGVSKMAQEVYSQVIHKNVVICRLANVFGPGSKGVIEKFIKPSEGVTVNGDGEQIRDFVHVDDVVRGLMKAVDWDPGTYELGSERGTPIKALAEATGKQITYNPALEGEIRKSILTNTAPDWGPTIDPIEYVKSKCHGRTNAKQRNKTNTRKP